MPSPAPPPAGFIPHYRQSPLTDPWEPLYSRKTADAVVLGLRAEMAHTNSRGFVHGGLISALADNAMGLSGGLHLRGDNQSESRSLVTVNLALDFLGLARVGQWLEFETTFVKAGATLCFTQAFVTADGEACARANAVFRVFAAAGR